MSCKKIPLRPANTIFLFFTPLKISIFINFYLFFFFTLYPWKRNLLRGLSFVTFPIFWQRRSKRKYASSTAARFTWIYSREREEIFQNPSFISGFALTCSAGPCCITNISASTEPLTCTWHWTGVQEKTAEGAGLQGVGYIAPRVDRYTYIHIYTYMHINNKSAYV